MRILTVIFTLLSLSAWSQDPTAYLNAFDAKIYSLKNKGVKDFVVDIQSSKLTKQLDEQMIFGKLKEVTFRTYWTANPERLAIEIIGLPEGFKEVKEDLKVSVLGVMDNLLPMTTGQRFAGYKFHAGSAPKEFEAKDTTGIATIQSYVLKFDKEDKLIEVVGNKAVGSLVMAPKYEKESFTDSKWILKSLTTTTSENGQTVIIKKVLGYGTSQGIGVLTKVTTSIEQKSAAPGAKPLNSVESVDFKNYKINSGDAFKYFLGSETKPTN